MFDAADYEPLKADDLFTKTVYQLQEKFIKQALFQELKRKDKDTFVILEWNGRKEKRLRQKKVHTSYFLANYDLAEFKRVKDKSLSPKLIGFEVKGNHKIPKKNGGFYWQIPRIHAGIGQALVYLQQDANQAYIVRPLRNNKVENEELIDLIEQQKYLGLIFATPTRKGKIQFDWKVKPKEIKKSKNQDRKKCNLHLTSVWQEAFCGDLRERPWARNAEF